jgi:hypothetical protein
MNKYKPEYLGKVLPDDKSEMTDFMHNKYEGFSKVFDVCKCESDKISDIKTVPSVCDNPNTYSAKITADDSAIKKICDANKSTDVKINGDVITAE